MERVAFHMLVKIKRIDKTLPLPRHETEGSVGFDLSARETIIIEPGKMGVAKLNIVACTPPGCMLMLAPRSSLCRKKNLLFPNSIGVIDQDYCGPEDEIMAPLWNIGTETVTIERGERIAQGIFVRIERVEWRETDEMSRPSRGGFGSTGGYDSSAGNLKPKS
jgi:dUTP pyrophosphatase